VKVVTVSIWVHQNMLRYIIGTTDMILDGHINRGVSGKG